MSMNRQMRVLVANGYYDLATPHFGSDYTVAHLGIAPELRDNITVSYYEAGHMMYVHRPSLEKIAGELPALRPGRPGRAEAGAPRGAAECCHLPGNGEKIMGTPANPSVT
jgi:hypothetical protein